MTALRPYPKYKPSGVPWLGDVPGTWELRRTKTILWERCEKGHPEEPLLAATQTKGVVRKEQYETGTVVAQKDLHLLKLVRIGDFVISLRSFQGGIEYARERGIISPAYTVLYPREPDTHGYLSWLFKSKPYVDNLTLYVTGIREGQNIDYEKLWRSELPLPPSGERANIVRYLDHVDRRIRKYIRAKQKLIALLNEQKQAIIHRAITGQIDVRTGKPYPKYKPSGVPWLGEIPDSWAVIAGRRLFTCRKDTALPGDEQLAATQAYGVIPQKEFERRVGRRVVQITHHLEKRRHVEPDDFVISMRSFQGGLERAWTRGCIRSSYVVLRPSTKVHVGFFAHLFKSYGYIHALQATANFIRDGQDLNFGNFCLVDLPDVPMQEQETIATFLDDATRGIDVAVARARKEIELIREYRTRLVADVVTGKLDVREAAANLPEELEEVEEAEVEAQEELEGAAEEAAESEDAEGQG